ncbi:MAG: hypothetical protein DDT31_00312 [Syntrophomonadaceae bacterium]|nr:hypothetical protein [Bacillota bacterium]
MVTKMMVSIMKISMGFDLVRTDFVKVCFSGMTNENIPFVRL